MCIGRAPVEAKNMFVSFWRCFSLQFLRSFYDASTLPSEWEERMRRYCVSGRQRELLKLHCNVRCK